MNKELDHVRLADLLDYYPDEGVMRWRLRPSSRARLGGVAGRERIGSRWQINIDGRSYYRSRLIWLFMTGEWPKHQIDHINRNPLDDRWENLREATPSQNMANRRPTGRLNVKGVYFNAGKFCASINNRSERIWLGRHPTIEAASAAYQKAARELYGEFAYGEAA